METTDQSDPYNWSIDQVIDELCHNKTPRWSSITDIKPIPDPAKVEQALRSNDIDGESLLVLEDVNLKSDLELKSFGQRREIRKIITYLRSISDRYQGPLRSVEAVQRFHDTTNPAITHVSQRSESGFDQSPEYHSAYETKSSIAPSRFSTSEPHNAHQTSARESITPQNALNIVRTTASSSILVDGSDKKHAGNTSPGNHGDGGFDLLDALETKIEASMTDDKNPDEVTTFDASAALSPSKRYVPTSKMKRRRIAPTFVSHINDPTRSNMPDPAFRGNDNTLGYLGSYAQTIKDVFYGPSADLEQSFVFTLAKCSPSQQRTMSTLMKHFFRAPILSLPGTKTIIRIPYSGNLIPPNAPIYYTAFHPNFPPAPQKARSMRDLQKKFQIVNPGTPLMTQPLQDNFDDEEGLPPELEELLQRHPTDEVDGDDTFPPYGDSGDEGNLDNQTIDEIEAEAREKQQFGNRNAMTLIEMNDAIDEAIREVRENWLEHRLPKIQLKAYRLWMKAAREGNRQPAMDVSIKLKRRAMENLFRARDHITKDVWHKAADVKFQCRNLEAYVEDQAEHEYLLQVLDQSKPPPRPTANATPRVRRARSEVPEGEELIDSESEMADDDFVVDDDSSEERSTPYDAVDEDDGWNPQIPTPEPRTKQHTPRLSLHTSSTSPPAQVPALATNSTGLGDTPQLRQASVSQIRDTESDEDVIPSSSRRSRPTKDEVAQSSERNPLPLPAMTDSEAEFTTPSKSRPTLRRPSFSSQSNENNLIRSGRDIIDLTISSPASGVHKTDEAMTSDFEVRTPQLNPTTAAKDDRKDQGTASKSEKKRNMTNSDPMETLDLDCNNFPDIQKTQQKSWYVINRLGDHRLALAKTVYELNDEEAAALLLYCTRLAGIADGVNDVLQRCMHGISEMDNMIVGIPWIDQVPALCLTILYLTYVCCEEISEPNDTTQEQIQKGCDCLTTGASPFFEYLIPLLRYHLEGSDEPVAIGDATESEILVDSDVQSLDLEQHEIDALNASQKKRKRKVELSQDSRRVQQDDQKRVAEQERRRELMMAKVNSMGHNGTDRMIPINTDEPVIYLDPFIARRVKEHQISGIQFMWRELIDDKKHQGCLLAHTMGLGKTMQVISLLVTIAQCNQSKNERIRAQIPEHLQDLQILILCPASLLDNWYDEILMWLPPGSGDVLGAIRKITGVVRSDKIKEIRAWAQNPGVLIIGYETFRSLVAPRKDGQELDEHEELENMLVKTPTLVVADEAHKMKNAKSKLSQMTKKFATLSRIALTGSPLNNHLEEYHTMIDWIAPGYLGSLAQFKSRYSDPISDGLWAESSTSQRRFSLRKLHILKRDLAPKINRADISAIAADMPSKTEFYITLPLTESQTKAYNLVVDRFLKEHRSAKKSERRALNARLWDWISILSWLCHHPSCFIEKLEKRSAQDEPANKLVNAPTPDENEAVLPDDVDMTKHDTLKPIVPDLVKIFEEERVLFGPDDPALSNRSLLTLEILKEAMRIGEKTLIFSHSIPTLNYLERMLDQINCRYGRIDGSTNLEKRQHITKAFNQPSSDMNALLISIRAGGLGLNIQGANRVIIYDFGFNPSWEEQAIGRAFRLGQKKPVFVYRLRAGGTFEDGLYNKAVFKQSLFHRVIDQKNVVRHATKNVESYLFAVKDIVTEDFSECKGKDAEVLDQVLHRVDFIRNIILTETFQQETEEDELTEQERRDADREWGEEQLQRSDPAAYAKLRAERALRDTVLQNRRLWPLPTNQPNYAQIQPNTQYFDLMPQLPIIEQGQGYPSGDYSVADEMYAAARRGNTYLLPNLSAQIQPNPPGIRSSYDDTYVRRDPTILPPRASSVGPPNLDGAVDDATVDIEDETLHGKSRTSTRKETYDADDEDEEEVEENCRTQ